MIGVNDMDAAKKFYCDLFDDQGAKAPFDAGRIAMIGKSVKVPTTGSGTMIAFPTET